MKISLCVLIGTLSVRLKTNPRLATTETTEQHGNFNLFHFQNDQM